MENQIFNPGTPDNEPILDYAPGSPERSSLEARLDSMATEVPEIPCIVGGEAIYTGEIREQVSPHNHQHVLARWHCATPEVVQKAIASAQQAWKNGHGFPTSPLSRHGAGSGSSAGKSLAQ